MMPHLFDSYPYTRPKYMTGIRNLTLPVTFIRVSTNRADFVSYCFVVIVIHVWEISLQCVLPIHVICFPEILDRILSDKIER